MGESNAVFALACRRFGCSENPCGIDWLCSKNGPNSYRNFFLYPMHSSVEMWHQLRVSKARSHLVSHVDRLANLVGWICILLMITLPSHPSNTPDHPTRSHALGGPIEYSASVPENGYRRSSIAIIAYVRTVMFAFIPCTPRRDTGARTAS